MGAGVAPPLAAVGRLPTTLTLALALALALTLALKKQKQTPITLNFPISDLC